MTTVELVRGRVVDCPEGCGGRLIVGADLLLLDGISRLPHTCPPAAAHMGAAMDAMDSTSRNPAPMEPMGTHGERRVRLTPASSIKPRPVRYVWDERIPMGELVLTPGRGGVGKSTFHTWLHAALTRGTLPGVYLGTPRAVLIAASEDSWSRTIVPRLIAAGADLDLVFRVDVVSETDDELTLTLPVDCEALEAEIRHVEAALLSVDPIISAIGGSLDTHKDRDVRQALEPLVKVADRTGCSVLGNAHFNKSGGSDPLALVMGSSAFGNVVRAVLGFARDTEADDGSCVISQVKNNLGRLDLPSLRYVIEPAEVQTEEGPAQVGKLVMLGESQRSVADILRDAGSSDESRSERSEAQTWLKDYLAASDGAAFAADVLKAARAAGLTENAVKKARAAIGAESKRTGFGQDAYYTWSLMGAHGSHGFRLPEASTHGIHEAPMRPSATRPCPGAAPSDPHEIPISRDYCFRCGWGGEA